MAFVQAASVRPTLVAIVFAQFASIGMAAAEPLAQLGTSIASPSAPRSIPARADGVARAARVAPAARVTPALEHSLATFDPRTGTHHTMPWIWRVLRERVERRLPRVAEQPRGYSIVVAPVVVRGPSDTVPGIGLAGAF